jgi:hypothetical protein
MGSYNDYIGELKRIGSGLDDRRLLAGIETKLKQRAERKKQLLEGSVALLLLVTVLYLNFRPSFSDGGDLLASYVFSEEPGNGPILDYVFE